MPGAAAGRPDPAGIEGIRYGLEGGCAAGLYLADNRQHVRREAISPYAVRCGAEGLRLGQIGPVAQGGPLRLLGRQRRAGPLRNQVALFLGQGRVNVQHERVCIGAKLGHDEGDALGHQARYERYVSREAAEFGHHHSRLGLAGLSKCLGQLGATLQRIRTLPRLDFHILGHNLAPLGRSEPGNGFALCFDAQAALALLGARNPNVADNLPHDAAPSVDFQTLSGHIEFVNLVWPYMAVRFRNPYDSETA